MLRQRGVRNTKVRAMMSTQSRYIIGAGVIAGLLGIPHTSSAQLNQLPYMLKYKTGQNIQPIFQGWSHNPDGSFEMHLGYLNRNYIEELHVPVGPDNNIQPGDQDRGQPTYFYTRAHRSVFSVTVPADFGDQELIWTVTAHGKTQQAVGWLEWLLLEDVLRPALLDGRDVIASELRGRVGCDLTDRQHARVRRDRLELFDPITRR